MALTTVTQTARHSDPYQAQREELALAFRWAARQGLQEAVNNHFSMVVSDDGTQFLMNPDGWDFARIKASDLLLLDANDPDCLKSPNAPDPTAWGIHGAIHRRVRQARCVLHLHPKYSTVLACLDDPTILPIDQVTMRFFNRVAVDSGFDGMGLGEEGERLANCLGNKSILLMGNHGVLVVADTIAQAIDDMYHIERAAETLITAYMTGQPLKVVSDEVAEKTAQQWENYPTLARNHLREIKIRLDREEPDYKQ